MFLPLYSFGNDDRAADGASEFVAHQVRRGEVRRVLTGFGDTEVVVARGFEQRTVELDCVPDFVVRMTVAGVANWALELSVSNLAS